MLQHTSPIDDRVAALLDKVARMNRALSQGSAAVGHPATIKGRIRAFAGAPGVGKSTCLGKWLARDVLAHGCDASVCRLDCQAADSTDSLAVLCESLGIRISRSWEVAAGRLQGNQTRFIDLPGMDCNDHVRLRALAVRLSALKHIEVYLVLNAAYHIEALTNQANAFSILPISGLILSHLDEVEGTGHLKDVSALARGMDCPVRFLGSGRGVPGIFEPPVGEMQAQNSQCELAESCVMHSSGRGFADIRRYL
jgi:flagellar biosynthesis GTPase FlhF